MTETYEQTEARLKKSGYPMPFVANGAWQWEVEEYTEENILKFTDNLKSAFYCDDEDEADLWRFVDMVGGGNV